MYIKEYNKNPKTYLTAIFSSYIVFWDGETKFVPSGTRLPVVDFSETKPRSYSMKGRSEGNS